MVCGAMCLRYVHNQHGHKLSLKRARRLAKTGRHGTYADDLVNALNTLGYKARVKHNLKWHELKRLVDSGADVICSWWSVLDDGKGHFSPPDGHYSVVTRVEQDKIHIFDPDAEEIIALPKEMFLSHWWDYQIGHGGRKDFIHAAVIARYKPKNRTVAHK